LRERASSSSSGSIPRSPVCSKSSRECGTRSNGCTASAVGKCRRRSPSGRKRSHSVADTPARLVACGVRCALCHPRRRR
jgi:hypothetical protein